MREFAISNADGGVYELNDLRNFFHEPHGLGFVRNANYVKIGDRYEISADSYEQASPTGYICFKDEKSLSAYAKYAAFTRFLQKIPLTLYYRSDKEHRMDVVPEIVEKTEIEKPLGLNISIGFRALSTWYDVEESNGEESTDILSDSMIESPCHIMITGILTNPTWIHEVNDIQVAVGQIKGNIASGETLHIRSDTNPYQIYKVDSDGVKTDLYAASNFSTERFFVLKNGKNTISCTGATSLRVIGRVCHATV